MDVFAKCVHFANVSQGKAKLNDKYNVVVSKDIKLSETTHLVNAKIEYK